MDNRRAGFTLVELMVAITVTAVVLLGAHGLSDALAVSVDRLQQESERAQRAANAERLLRSLVGRLEVGTDRGHEFAGDERHATFTTWCDVPAGWQERCNADLALEPDSGTMRLTIRVSTGEVIVLRRGIHGGALRYLNDPVAGGLWFEAWGRGLTAPLAIGIVTASDTTIVRIGGRG